jgi:hypothetical protein
MEHWTGMNKITINVLEAMIQYTRQTFDATCNTISDGMYYKKAKQNQRNETTETKPQKRNHEIYGEIFLKF